MIGVHLILVYHMIHRHKVVYLMLRQFTVKSLYLNS